MIILRENKNEVADLYKFVTYYSVPRIKFAKYLGFVIDTYQIDGKITSARVVWLNEQPVIGVTGRKLGAKVQINALKVISPYYKQNSLQGEVSHDSYISLFNNLQENYHIAKSDAVDDPALVRMLNYKSRAEEGNNILIASAELYYRMKLSTLQGQIIRKYTDKGITKYDIRMFDSVSTLIYNVPRCVFKLVHQDEYALAEIQCAVCKKF